VLSVKTQICEPHGEVLLRGDHTDPLHRQQIRFHGCGGAAAQPYTDCEDRGHIGTEV